MICRHISVVSVDVVAAPLNLPELCFSSLTTDQTHSHLASLLQVSFTAAHYCLASAAVTLDSRLMTVSSSADTVIICQQSYLLLFGIPSPTHSFIPGLIKTFLFCKSFPQQPFLFLLQDSLRGFPRLFTVTSEHVRFYFLVFLFYTF